MSASSLFSLSNQMADAVAAVAPSVAQVHGRRRPASGLVHSAGVVITSARALGRDDGLRIRDGEGRAHEAELAGWDPATDLAVLRAPGLEAPAIARATEAVRVGQLALAVARSWSNAITASAGIVSVIGGPLPTRHGRQIDRIIRTSAPMHDGFAGGAFVDVAGRLTGVATAAAIRGLGVVIPTDIAWATAASLLEHGSIKRGYLGLAGQRVRLADRQRTGEASHALLVVGVSPGSPADRAGLVVGDVLVEFDGRPVESPMDLLELLVGDRIGRSMTVRVVRGMAVEEMAVTIGERPASRE